MQTVVRPFVATSVALIGASVITVAPVAPFAPAVAPQSQVTGTHMPSVQLSASVAEIFTLPAFRQYILNRIDDLFTLGVGLGRSAAALGESLVQIPAMVRTVTQQVLAGDLLGALTTLEASIVGTVVAVGEPTLAAIIERRQRNLAVQQALQVAVPEALFDVVGGFGRGADEIARAFIIAGQDLVDAVLPFDLGEVVDALVNGTRLVVQSFVDGGQHVVDGIVSAQETLAAALRAQPTPPSATALTTDIASPQVHQSPNTARLVVGLTTDTTDLSGASDIETSFVSSDSTEGTVSLARNETPDVDEDNIEIPIEDEPATTVTDDELAAEFEASEDESAASQDEAAASEVDPTAEDDKSTLDGDRGQPHAEPPNTDTEE